MKDLIRRSLMLAGLLATLGFVGCTTVDADDDDHDAPPSNTTVIEHHHR